MLADGIITDTERSDLLVTLKEICGFQVEETGAVGAAIATIPFATLLGLGLCYLGQVHLNAKKLESAADIGCFMRASIPPEIRR